MNFFLDTLTISDRENNNVDTFKTDIAWPSDKERKYNNPQGSTDENSPDFSK